MTDTPISDEARICSEPHGYSVVPYCVAMALEIENVELRKEIGAYKLLGYVDRRDIYEKPTHACDTPVCGEEHRPVAPEEVYSPHTKIRDIK